ncbi:hypothetical protein [Antarctobacter sp.]|uniref:hypothetical protein n=1 Tax=Antarctobacter sp. TaxID=1872577 RepID=UPI002B267CC8|nr:hypothetical protein [Antarctobacter sp.]
MKRPAVKDHLQKVQGAYVSEVSANQAVYKAQALDVAFDLMMNAKSESVRARMAEFLASDGKTPQVSVHVDARHGPSGYEYARPGQKIVQIVDSDDGNPDQGTTRPAVGGIAAPD